MKTKGTITWIPVSSGQLPVATEDGYNTTHINGTSDRVLVQCVDGEERFARYINNKHLTQWSIVGCTGQPADFVTHFAYINKTN